VAELPLGSVASCEGKFSTIDEKLWLIVASVEVEYP
jgi:hypothetical protein